MNCYRNTNNYNPAWATFPMVQYISVGVDLAWQGMSLEMYGYTKIGREHDS